MTLSFANLPNLSTIVLSEAMQNVDRYERRKTYIKVGEYAISSRDDWRAIDYPFRDRGFQFTPIYQESYLNCWLNSSEAPVIIRRMPYTLYQLPWKCGYLYGADPTCLETVTIKTTVPKGYIKSHGHEITTNAKVWLPTQQELEDANSFGLNLRGSYATRESNPKSYKIVHFSSTWRTRNYVPLGAHAEMRYMMKPNPDAMFTLNDNSEWILSSCKEKNDRQFAALFEELPGFKWNSEF